VKKVGTGNLVLVLLSSAQFTEIKNKLLNKCENFDILKSYFNRDFALLFRSWSSNCFRDCSSQQH